MWTTAFLVPFFSIIIANTPANGEIPLHITTIPNFPFSAEKSFEIALVSKELEGKLSDKFTDMMVIQISELDGQSLEKAIFDYGFKIMIDQEFKGEYMRIPLWQKSADELTINVTMVFTRRANSKLLELYQLSPLPTERRQLLAELNLARRIISRKIQLLIAPRLELDIRSQDGRKGEIMLDQSGIATCRAYEGVPPQRPTWINLDTDFRVLQKTFSVERNQLEAHIAVTVMDHLKLLQCRAGDALKSVRVNVLHAPSQINLEPEIGALVENGSTVVCVAIDGYPSPDIRWHLLRGPPNGSRFFNISKDGRKLHLTTDAPLNSEWTFNCTATNVLPTFSGVFNRTVAFTVGRQQEGLFGLNLTLQIMIGVAVMGAIIVFCIVIVFIVCIARRSCASQSESRNHRRNGGPVKTAAEKKTLEAEQVTLLPPGAPQNHLDIANTGSGLPPPPPEYQLIIDNNEIKSVIPLDQQVSSEAYPEVTYAELNTSDLPMKVTMYHKANNNDDQVIYSQIIGTMSTPDCAQRGGAAGPGGYLDSENV